VTVAYRSQFEEGTIPGAISVPYLEAADRLGELGCEIDFDGWICEGDLPQVVLFCNGPWCGQSPTAARRMIEAGFPAENISYYRGGMQNWNGARPDSGAGRRRGLKPPRQPDPYGQPTRTINSIAVSAQPMPAHSRRPRRSPKNSAPIRASATSVSIE
jgi:rhodanese-related sulfurtransferase